MGLAATISTLTRLSDAAPIPEVTLRKGLTETISFDFGWSIHPSSHWPPIYTIGYDFKKFPFGGTRTNPNGFLDKSQPERFRFDITAVTNHSCIVRLTINNVRYEDRGTLEAKVYVFSETDQEEISSRKFLNVSSPPDKAKCILLSRNFHDTGLYEVDCDTNSGAALSCFQNETSLPYLGYVSDNGLVLRAKFLMIPLIGLYCCSHFKSQNVTQETCTDFVLDQSDINQVQSQTAHPEESNKGSKGTTAKSSIAVNSGCYVQCNLLILIYIALPALFFFTLS